MKKTIISVLALVGAAAILVGLFLLWGVRPWRTAVMVNGHVLTARELSVRATGMMKDAEKYDHLLIPQKRRAEARRHFEREVAQLWIFKEIMLDEAVARRLVATPAEERESLARMNKQLASRHMTADQFFKNGPLPEEQLRREFKEGVLVNKLVDAEVTSKIKLTSAEIDRRLDDLRRAALVKGVESFQKPSGKIDRKLAIDSLRNERYREAFRDFYRAARLKATVASSMFPDLESFGAGVLSSNGAVSASSGAAVVR